MAFCAPQRYVANNRNLLLDATLTPSSVLPVAGQVVEVPVARVGSGAVVIEGSYTGAAEAVYDIEVLDELIDTPVVTKPVAVGEGSGTLENIVAGSTTPEDFVVELQNDGVPEIAAGVDFEGVRIVARTTGNAGNSLSLSIDRSGLVFTDQAFSLLDDLPAGSGTPDDGLTGPQYDWDTAVLGGDNIVPATAHRVAFGEDTSAIYLQYKKFTDGEWRYHFIPAIKRTIPAGTIVKFVTGSRDVNVEDSAVVVETFSGIVTVYDLLNAIKTTSTYLDVSGVVAYDRSPTGQASREVLLRTDAHCELSTGSGSKWATGFSDTFANANAATELVTAECYAVSSKDHPLARVGYERWKLKGSVSGDLGEIVTGDAFVDPDDKFGLTIPQKFPETYGGFAGRFSHVETNYVSRDDDLKPPLCPVALTLGANAVDQQIRLTWTKRPSGDCSCSGMKVPRLSAFCLGLVTTGGETLDYQADTVARLISLYDWYQGMVIERTDYAGSTTGAPTTGAVEDPAVTEPSINSSNNVPGFAPSLLTSIQEMVEKFEEAAALLDPITDTTLRAAGFDAWDDGVAKLEYDVDGITEVLLNIAQERYYAAINFALISGGLSPLGKSDADTITSGDGCWRDLGGDYWTVVGSEGAYAPCFNNAPYYSSRTSADGKQYFSTKEFGFQINVKCPDLLVYGDEIILQIGTAGQPTTYQIGDKLTLPIIAGQNLDLNGGQDGDEVLLWYVSGSVSGALPSFSYDPDTPSSYTATGVLEFDYVPGGIPNRKGDRFTFSVEGGHYRWRKDGGSWITGTGQVIDEASASLDEGLTLRFVSGASPSFVSEDRFTFRALQPWAVDNVKNPDALRWKWSGSTPTLDVDVGSIQPISAALIARHSLPDTATITLHGGDAAISEWSEVLPWREGVIFFEFATPRTARYLQFEITGAADAAIAWAWAGIPLTTELSADVQVRPSYRIESGNTKIDQGGRYLAKATSGSVRYSDIALKDADVEGLLAMIDHAKRNDDEPLVIVPNVERPDEAYLAQIGVDEFNFAEITGNNATPGVRERRFALDFPFAGVWQ